MVLWGVHSKGETRTGQHSIGMATSNQSDQSSLGSLLGVMWGTPINVSRVATNPINSDVSTAHTIEIMRSLAKASANSPIIESACQSAIQSLQTYPPTFRALASAVFYWIKNHVTFKEDEEILWYGVGEMDTNKELLIPPVVLLAMPQPMGDCDDFSLLAASMLLHLGIPTTFVTIAADSEDVNKFSHIYVKVYLSDEREQGGYIPNIPLDCSHGMYPGWEAPNYTRKQEWEIK